MAERALKMIFNDPSRAGKEVQVSVPKADDTKTGAEIKAVMEVIMTNKEIFVPEIGDIKGAKFLTPLSYTNVTLPA